MTQQAEIKVTLEGDRLTAGLDLLSLKRDSRMTVWFLDDVSPGMTLPLLEAGVVIRVRVGPDEGDCTVKLRPGRRSQLMGRWLADSDDLRVEEDWVATRRVLAASLQVDLDASTLALEPHTAPPADLLSADQESYLAACAPVPVNPLGLTVLGPIRATRWKSVEAPGLGGLDVRAERWTLPGLDFLELSVKTDREGAEEVQRVFESALSALGLLPETPQETKTRRVLEALTR